MIQVEKLRLTYAEKDAPALVVDQLQIAKGECVVLCGKSGSGKTSFLRLLNGLIPEYDYGVIEGHAAIGTLVAGQQTVEDFAEQVGTVFQNPATQFFHRLASEELVFGCENQGVAIEEIERRLKATNALLELESLLDLDLLQASGGQRQKIAIGAALMQQPQILLLDEPTANLDQIGIQQVTQALTQLKEVGYTILIAEHRLHFLMELADRFLYFDQGVLTEQWTASQFAQLTTAERQALGLRALNLTSVHQQLQSKIATTSVGLDGVQLVQLAIGYDRTIAEIADYTFPSGMITGITGPNGIGKSTLLLTLAGLISVKSGKIKFQGQFPTRRTLQQQTAYVMQDVRLQLVANSVAQELHLGTIETEHYEQVLTELNLRHLLDAHPLTLSGGEQQRLMIAHARLSQKAVYLFDEPTSGLDFEQMQHVQHLLQQLKAMGKVVIVISHDEEFLAESCDRIFQMTNYHE